MTQIILDELNVRHYESLEEIQTLWSGYGTIERIARNGYGSVREIRRKLNDSDR